MVKRFNKKQGSKQGIILLTVVFILAMAIIFISACMLMTRATRDRMYWKAEQSQARLTVTSAAEAFYQALEVGDFKQSALETLAKGSANGIFMTATDATGKSLPGMGTTSDNCTLLSLKAKDADCSEIYAYLTTTIGEEKESVKITFKMKEQTSISGLFDNPVDFNGCPKDFNFDSFGYTNGQTVSDNFLVVRKGSDIGSHDGVIYSNVVFVGGTVSDFRIKQQGDADVIFLKDAQLAPFTTNWQVGNAYFVGTSGNSDSLTGTGIFADSFVGSGKSIVFANRNYNYSFDHGDNVPIYQINLSSTYSVTGSSKYSGPDLTSESLSSVSSKAAKYASSTFADPLASFPTTSEAFAKVSIGDGTLKQTAPSDYYALNLTGTGSFLNKYGNLSTATAKIVGDDDGNGVVEHPFIKISGGSIGNDTGSAKLLSTESQRCVFLLDGNTDYVIYLTGDCNFYQCMFAVVNPSPDHRQVFVLEKDVDVVLGNQNGGYMGAFLSVQRTGFSDSAATYLTYLFDSSNLSGEITSNKISKYHDSVQKPTIYIMGAENNTFMFHKETFGEAYLGLFNPTEATTSGVTQYNSPIYFYGRMMFDTWDSTSDGAHFYMPYCPGIDAGGAKPAVELYEFGYDVVSVDYYFTE